jgi:hypothetical protein
MVLKTGGMYRAVSWLSSHLPEIDLAIPRFWTIINLVKKITPTAFNSKGIYQIIW